MTNPNLSELLFDSAVFTDDSSALIPASAPYSIDIAGTKASLAFELKPFTLNDPNECGIPNYEFSTVPAVSFSQTSSESSKITFNDIKSYDIGVIKVTVKITGSKWSNLVIYDYEFDITVIDCLSEAFQVPRLIYD